MVCIPRGGLTSHAATPSETPKQLSVPLTLWMTFPYRKQYVDRQVVALMSPFVACETQAGRNEHVRAGATSNPFHMTPGMERATHYIYFIYYMYIYII